MILTLAQVREPLLQILTGSGWGGVHPGVHLHKNPANHTGKMSALHQHVTPGCALDTGASTPGVPARCLYSVKLSRRCRGAAVTAAVWLLLAQPGSPASSRAWPSFPGAVEIRQGAQPSNLSLPQLSSRGRVSWVCRAGRPQAGCLTSLYSFSPRL